MKVTGKACLTVVHIPTLYVKNMSRQPFEDHRDHPRYNIDPGAFAVFRRDLSVLPGLIADISKGGLAFFYHHDEDWPENDQELYYLFGEKCNVEDVPLITTNDIEITDTNHPIYRIMAVQKSGRIIVRRRGVKYGNLTPTQQQDIEALVDEYHRVIARIG